MRRPVLRLALLLVALFAGCVPAFAQETAAEHLANRAAQAELSESPRHGNIPSYRLAPDDLVKAEHLEHVRTVLEFGGTVWSIVSLFLLLHYGIIGRMQRMIARFRNRWVQGYFFLLLFTLAMTLLSLPLDIYDQGLRRHYGLSVQSWASWLGDQAKSFGLGWLFGGLLVMLLFFVIRKAPARWWLIFWSLSIPITVGALFATPYIIDPLFNHFEPLNASHPELVQRLEQVAQRGNMNIPPERMFLMKASEKSTTLNAYVTGFGTSKRVVVWDTSIAKGTPDQILFIFGHESGHYVLHHIVRGVVESMLGLLLMLYLGYRFVQPLLRRYGPRWGVTDQTQWGALAVLLLIASVLGAVSRPISEAMSRSKEHAADVYGQEAVHGLLANPQDAARGAFQILGQTSFDDPNPSPIVEWWTYSHPAIGRRAAFAAHYDPWQPGLEPRYFPKH
ncbi:M48 family metallopeptidase [Terriglobus sp.]|uniref:M48 family metallopeptidase n=1 Tax=Terriglobus sp. TaxID=1889013 RepID=UPI003B00E336